MISILLVLIVFLVILACLVCVGVGVGLLLHWMLPGLELGVASLIGTIAGGLALHFAVRVVRATEEYAVEQTVLDEMSEFFEEPVQPRRRSRRKKI